jgi:uncharacterized protein (TIGR02996 family)
MSDGDALLAAIVADPDDDLPRLAYADWLQENGDSARAEFIRTQIESARLPAGENRHRDLETRGGNLFAKHKKAWLKEFTQAGLMFCKFRRGFVERAVLNDEKKFLKHAAELLQRTPLVELAYDFDFDPREEDEAIAERIDEFLASPFAGRVTNLEVGDEDGGPLLFDLLACQALDGITTIHCEVGELPGAEVAEAIAKAKHLKRLRNLTLHADEVGDDGLTAIVRAAHLKNLERLDLGETEYGTSRGITEEGVAELAASRQLKNLRWLDLCGNWIESEGAVLLSRAKSLAALESLFLVGCNVEERGLLALAESKKLTDLRELVVEMQTMTVKTARALAASPLAGRARRLSLHVFADDREEYKLGGRGLFASRFGDEVIEALEAGFGERVEFEVLDWE